MCSELLTNIPGKCIYDKISIYLILASRYNITHGLVRFKAKILRTSQMELVPSVSVTHADIVLFTAGWMWIEARSSTGDT